MKYAFITDHCHEHRIKILCRVLGVSRSGYYAWLVRPLSERTRENLEIVRVMREIHADVMETYGSPRMHVELVESGFSVSLGRVERLMRAHGIAAKQSKRHRRTHQHRATQGPAENVLNGEFAAPAPNEKWVCDITFIETRQGWLYLAIVLDLYSRAIVGWSMSEQINGKLVEGALAMAIEQRDATGPTLVHSDQGSQYTSAAYRQKLKDSQLLCSMSRKGACYDNAVAESFFHTLKNELVYDKRYETRAEAKQSIFKYIELFYNRKRRHSYLNYQAPLEYEKMQAVA
ncbi:MAG TPA: IS3 family transposase [Gammaproteobacteria bacterium]